MLYIIDGNNLAGELGLLEQKEFDLELARIVGDYFLKKQIDVFLVFDSDIRMGDKREAGNIRIIYTPRDDYYDGADDKIVEIVEMVNGFKHNYLKLNFPVDGVKIITSDIELRAKISRVFVKNKGYIPIELIRSDEFVKKIDRQKPLPAIDEKYIGGRKKTELNRELLDLWEK